MKEFVLNKLKKHSKAIEGVQRRATKLVKELRDKSYDYRLKDLNLSSLKARRLRGDLRQLYKIIKGIDILDSSKIININTNSTRNKDYKIYIKYSRSNIRKFCFSNRISPIWNNLPSFMKNSSSVNLFKNKIDNSEYFKDLRRGRQSNTRCKDKTN